MLDLKKFFSENGFADLVNRLKYRGIAENQLIVIRDCWEKEKKILQNIIQLRQQRNQLESPENAEKVRQIKEKITLLEKELHATSQKLDNLTSQLPNLPASNTPTNQEGNRIIDHTDYPHKITHNLTFEKILKKLGLIDEEKSILLSGSKFAVYQGFGSQLLQALINFMLAVNTQRGYQLFSVPYLVKENNLYNTGQLPKFKEDLYKIENSNFFLIPTAEVSLVNLYQEQTLTETELPLNLCAYSPCFRAEAGAPGQENKGLIRLHQFHKVELVKIFSPENSYSELEKLLVDARNILHLLKIPHRVIELCHVELGFQATKTYDIEVWLPISKRWLEISSCSNCEDFQSRRAKIRVKKKDGTKYYPHTLNGSALAIDRLIVILCEYYYNEKENKLEIPATLEKYFFK